MKIEMISVIIPTYNRANVIRKCIDSVLAQTIQEFEIIIIDDCSNDETRNIVNQYNDKRIRYYRMTKRSGACAARNKGINLARGEFVAFQDSDDVWDVNKLKKQYDALCKNESDIIFCKIKRKMLDNKSYEIPKEMKGSRFVTKADLFKASLASTQTILGKKKCFVKIRFDENMPRLQDWDIVLRLIDHYSIYYLEDVLVNVILQKNSISYNHESGVVALKKIIEKHINYLNENAYIKAELYYKLGYLISMNNGDPYNAYKQSLSTKFTLKAFVRICMSKLHIKQYRDWKRGHLSQLLFVKLRKRNH